MKKTILALLSVLLLTTAVKCEPARILLPRKIVRTRISTVDQLRGLKLRSQPTKVMSGQIDFKMMPQLKSNFNIGMMQSIGNAVIAGAYKTGTGVVLKPTCMTDPNTKSELNLLGATMNQKLVDQVLAKSNAPVSMMCSAGQHANLGFLFAQFRNLPYGKHLYMVTLHMSVKMDRAEYLTLFMGSNYVAPSGITVMGDDYRTLVTFDPGPGNGSMDVIAKFNMPQDDAMAFLDFSYLQLAQVD